MTEQKPTQNSEQKPAAGLSWLDNDTPVSNRFDDSYYSSADGLEETKEVYLSGNGLPERWRDEKTFTVAELGFGTGLNFFETLVQWNRRTHKDGHLTYVSFELYPIEAEELIRAVSRWFEITDDIQKVLDNWPPADAVTTITFDTAELQLYTGDARETINAWNGAADAWYLDGFSPAKNPELWDADLLKSVFDHTNKNGTFSTFTSAGWVKRNLVSAGFDVKKVPGFRYKKERLQGSRTWSKSFPQPS